MTDSKEIQDKTEAIHHANVAKAAIARREARIAQDLAKGTGPDTSTAPKGYPTHSLVDVSSFERPAKGKP